MSRSDLHASAAPSAAPTTAVVELHWPREADRRLALAEGGVPRLLFIAPGHTPPAPIDLYEDWVRVPAGVDEVEMRSANLARRVQEREHLLE